MANGQCNCGAVRFEVTSDLRDVYVCHCSICRRATGANGIAVLVVKNEDFRWLEGEDKISSWARPGPDGKADWQRHFCPKCGTPLPGANDDATPFIPAGSITEGGDNLRVAHHIYVESRACWDVIGEDGQQHPEKFGSG